MKKALTKESLKIYLNHAMRYKWHVFGILFGVVGHVILHNFNPILFKKIVDLLVQGGKENAGPALNVVILMFFISLLRMIFARAFNFLTNYLQPKVMADLNNTCFQYLQRHSYAFFTGSFVGSLVTRVKRFERAFEQIADQFTFELGRTFLEALFIQTVLFMQNTTLALISLGWMIAYIIFSYYFSLYKLPYDIKRANSDTQVTAQLADSITNNVNVKTFSNYTLEEKRFFESTQNQFRLRKKSWDLGTIGDIFQAFSMIIVHTSIIYISIKFWQADAITLGSVVLIETYWFRLTDKLWNVGKNIRTIYEAIADANEMTEILITPHEVQDVAAAKTLLPKQAGIEFKNADFTYPDGRQVLKNFSLKIHSGEKVALIGPSGGGKSTMVKLLLRFHDLQAGQILIDSQDISKVTQNSLREALALVPQEPILFHRTLMENIRYSKPDANDEEVTAAAKAAHAHEFISTSKQGYNTLVGERGIKLSGGERQRVAIARAILKNAPILILDEATSSLDSESEFYIQDALKTLMTGKTVIVIAHRLSTISQMDRILVLEDGKITESGKHQELLKAKQGTYQRLWQIQAGSFL